MGLIELMLAFLVTLAAATGNVTAAANALGDGYTALCEDGLNGTYQQSPKTGEWECVDLGRD